MYSNSLSLGAQKKIALVPCVSENFRWSSGEDRGLLHNEGRTKM
jgi:hypothetical protein